MPDPAIGSIATYHGSLMESHGDGYRVFPCDSPLGGYCDRCSDTAREEHASERLRYALVAFDGRRSLTHVRPGSFTTTAITPAGPSVPVRVRGFLYLVSHVSPSPWIDGAHRLHFYTGEPDVLGSVHAQLDEQTLMLFTDRGDIRPDSGQCDSERHYCPQCDAVTECVWNSHELECGVHTTDAGQVIATAPARLVLVADAAPGRAGSGRG